MTTIFFSHLAKYINHRLWQHRPGGASGMRAGNFRSWLAEATREERSDTEKWDKAGDIIHSAIRAGQIPTECGCHTVVLITKGERYFCGFVIVEVIWKVVSGVVNCWIGSVVYFRYMLHGLRADRGTGITSLDVNLLQKLTVMREKVLYEVFLILQKIYYTLYWECCMVILVGYVIRPRTERVFTLYWDRLLMVSREGQYYGTPFQGSRGVDQ